jgi:hypothetical protein
VTEAFIGWPIFEIDLALPLGPSIIDGAKHESGTSRLDFSQS